MKRPTDDRTLTPEGIGSALDALGWKQSDLARRCGLAGKTVSRWCTGQAPAPLWLSEYLGALVALRGIHQRYVSPVGLGAFNDPQQDLLPLDNEDGPT
jgi:transcriptional regulator with XRE-family HTH domain